MNNESVGKKIVEALKKQAENMDMEDTIDSSLFEEPVVETVSENIFESNEERLFAESEEPAKVSFFDDVEEDKEPIFSDTPVASAVIDNPLESFEMPANIAVLKKLISQLPSGVSRHTGAQIIKQTMEALGISMKGVLQEAQQVQESINASARECQNNIAEYKRQISMLENQTQKLHRQYSMVNDIISLFIQAN